MGLYREFAELRKKYDRLKSDYSFVLERYSAAQKVLTTVTLRNAELQSALNWMAEEAENEHTSMDS